jgi:hypothetical protein
MEVSNKDPEQYLDSAVTAGAGTAEGDAPDPASTNPASTARADNSLGIGSLKGR